MGDTNSTEENNESVAFSDMTATQLQEAQKAIIEDPAVVELAAKPTAELTGPEIAQKREIQSQLSAIETEFTARAEDIALDLGTELKLPVAEEVEETEETETEETETEETEEVEEPGPASQTEADKVLEMASQTAHKNSGGGGGENKPALEAPSKKQPLIVAGMEGAANVDNTRAVIVKAGMEATDKTDWRTQVAALYKAATKDVTDTKTVQVWESQRYTEDTMVMGANASSLYAAEAMGLSGDLNRADACNPRFINDTEFCVSPESEAQAWMPKFAMNGECQVKTKDPETSSAPTFFEWAYEEDFGGTAKTGLVVGNDVPFPYDPADETTWKPLSQLTTTCSENLWQLRSVGYIREITRGQDLCDPAAVARAMQHDSAYLEQMKSQAVINAFDTYAADKGTAHTFDGGATSGFVNPASALSMMAAKLRAPYERQYGVSFSNATLFLPTTVAALLGVARYESLSDNARYTSDMFAEILGVGDVVMTNGITASGLDPDVAVPAAIPNGPRAVTIPMYLSWRAGWRQGQGPGVRGSVTSDERNLRGNKRLVMVEDDLVNIHMGCLSTIKADVDLCFVGGHANGSDVTC